jgi:hypothetical protein
MAANRRYREAMAAGLPTLTERPQEIRAALWRIYDGLEHKAIFPVNLLHPSQKPVADRIVTDIFSKYRAR